MWPHQFIIHSFGQFDMTRFSYEFINVIHKKLLLRIEDVVLNLPKIVLLYPLSPVRPPNLPLLCFMLFRARTIYQICMSKF